RSRDRPTPTLFPYTTLSRSAHRPISLGMGEPKHPTPQLIKSALTGALGGLARYPATAGEPELRHACASWAQRRYGVTLDASTQRSEEHTSELQSRVELVCRL